MSSARQDLTEHLHVEIAEEDKGAMVDSVAVKANHRDEGNYQGDLEEDVRGDVGDLVDEEGGPGHREAEHHERPLEERHLPAARRNNFKNMRSPRSQAETISRLASISYFEETLPQLRKIAAPLFEMVKSEKFKWGPLENASWEAIKVLIV